MDYTWGEIQIESCKKMFLNNGPIKVEDLSVMKTDNKYKWYLDAMPQACNEAINEVLKKGKKHIKRFSFSIPERKGLVLDKKETFTVLEETKFVINSAKSYYFEVNNEADIAIVIDGVMVDTIYNPPSANNSYTVYKGFINNPNDKDVEITFNYTRPYQVRNFGVYSYDYNYDDQFDIENIPNNTYFLEINLKDKIEDFYKINKFYYQDDGEYKEMINNTDYQRVNNNVIVIDGGRHGNYIIEYMNYPEKITNETLDNHIIELEPECAALLPLYIASQLYKDDDISLATQYRNEFEVGINNRFHEKEDLKFTSNTGWL